MIVTRTMEFPMGHRLATHMGLCRHIHGHNYRVQVNVSGERDINGIVIDFKALKEILADVFDKYDHALVLAGDDPVVGAYMIDVDGGRLTADQAGFGNIIAVPFAPTAENLAEYWMEELQRVFHARRRDAGDMYSLIVHSVTVWESSTTSAMAVAGGEA